MIELLIEWWQFTIVGVLVFLAWVGSLVFDKAESKIELTTTGMPNMVPIPIPTKGKGFWGGVWTWIMVSRTWEITKDFQYSIDGENYVIPRGFVFDGASVPKFLRTWLSPMGVLLIGGLIHDYSYKYTVLLKKGKKNTSHVMTQKQADQTFRDINIEVNGFRFINYLAYYALRLGGFMAWNGHRKRGIDWKRSTKKGAS